MARRLLLQLLATLATASLRVVSPADATLPGPVLATSPVDATTPAAVLDASPVHATPPSPGVSAAIFRGARRLGPPRLLLSDNPADAAAPSSPGAHAAADHSLWLFVFGVFSPIIVFVVAGLIRGVAWAAIFIADLYAATSRSMREARNNAVRVRPLDQDAVAAAGP